MIHENLKKFDMLVAERQQLTIECTCYMAIAEEALAEAKKYCAEGDGVRGLVWNDVVDRCLDRIDSNVKRRDEIWDELKSILREGA